MTTKYTLRVPFQIQPGYAFGGTGPSSQTSFDNLTVFLDQTPGGYALRLDGFPSSDVASQFIPRVWAGLTTLMVERGSAFSGSMAPQSVVYTASTAMPPAGSIAQPLQSVSGKAFDGIADEDAPSIYQTSKNVGFVHGFAPDLRITVPADRVLTSVVKGLQAAIADRLFGDQRFHTAVDLYSGALFEQSPAARLLTLSTALEVLAPVTYKHDSVQRLIEGWKASVEDAKSAHIGDQTALAALKSLERELLFRRETSIRGRVREFVYREFGADDNATELARRAISAYDARSILLHDGRLDAVVQARAIEDFSDVLRGVFERRIISTAA